MQIILCCVMTMFSAYSQVAAAQLDDIFSHWTASQATTKSLVVQFALENSDEKESAAGKFRFLRTPTGEIFASYELQVERQNGKKEHVIFLLNNGNIYLLSIQNKTAIRWKFAKGELEPFLRKYFVPFASLLDRKHSETIWKMKLVEHNDWYNYIELRPRNQSTFLFASDRFNQARIVVMQRETDKIPKGMPRQIWLSSFGSSSQTFNIESWKFNPVDGPKVEDFAKPEDRLGWEVLNHK